MRLLRSAERAVKRLWFRLQHGFWPEEWYSLDTALARWLSVRLAYLSVNTVACPQTYADQHGLDAGFEAWRVDLGLVARDLQRYAESYDAETWEVEKECIQAGQDAMLWVANNLRDLWD